MELNNTKITKSFIEKYVKELILRMKLNINIDITKSFFEKYEKELIQRAETAGLMKHRPSIGALKEFLTKSVLNSVLPDCCSLVSGQIFDGKGNLSKQVDIIIYDSRLPKLEIAPGFGYYAIEGVIACIEIKSKLDKKNIEEALDNSKSILELEALIAGDIKLATTEGLKNPNTAYQKRKASFQYSTACYVFSFDSIKMTNASKHVNNWFKKCVNPTTATNCALLPRVLVGKNWVGLLEDGYIELPGNGNAMIFVNTEHTFAYFISHLLNKVALRVRASQGCSDSYFTFNPMLPIAEYLSKDDVKNKSIVLKW